MAALVEDRPAEVTPSRRHRTGRRHRALLLAGVAATLAWATVSFVADAGTATPSVNLVPGLGPDGSIAEVIPLTSTVTRPSGAAHLQAGVHFARVDVAKDYHQKVRVSLSWTNPTAFKTTSQVANWQIRFALYYPAHSGACVQNEGPDLDIGAVTVTQGTDVWCAYRDESADGPGAVTQDGVDQGTQFLATDDLVGDLRPRKDQTAAPVCTADTRDACYIGSSDVRTYFVIGSIQNPGGHAPPGNSASIEGMSIWVRAERVGS